MAQLIFETLQKLDKKDYPDTGYTGYMMPPQYFRLFSPVMWNDRPNAGESFVLDRTLVTKSTRRPPKTHGQQICPNMKPSEQFTAP
jgi:hypothetical protein